MGKYNQIGLFVPRISQCCKFSTSMMSWTHEFALVSFCQICASPNITIYVKLSINIGLSVFLNDIWNLDLMKTCYMVFPFEYYPLSLQKTQKNDYSSFLLPTLERDTWLFSWFIFFIDGDPISPKALKLAFHLKFSEICHTLSIEVQSNGFIQVSEAKVSFGKTSVYR